MYFSVQTHLAACDFCHAEQTFLRRYPPCDGGEAGEAAPPIPFSLFALAESLFLLRNEETESHRAFDAA